VWSNSGSGSTCLVSGIVMLFVSLFFMIGSFCYVELCRGIIYDHSKGNIFKVTIIYTMIEMLGLFCIANCAATEQ